MLTELNAHEVAALFAAAAATRHPARDSATIALLLDTGSRRGELAALAGDDLILDTGWVWIGDPNRRRPLRLGAKATELVTLAADGQPDQFLRELTERTVHELLRRIGRSAIERSLTCRDTRRTWLTLSAKSIPMPLLVTLAGHQLARVPPIGPTELIEAQMAAEWISPLDRIVTKSTWLAPAA
jgi:integrase